MIYNYSLCGLWLLLYSKHFVPHVVSVVCKPMHAEPREVGVGSVCIHTESQRRSAYELITYHIASFSRPCFLYVYKELLFTGSMSYIYVIAVYTCVYG